jgi:hypothetical protein
MFELLSVLSALVIIWYIYGDKKERHICKLWTDCEQILLGDKVEKIGIVF